MVPSWKLSQEGLRPTMPYLCHSQVCHQRTDWRGNWKASRSITIGFLAHNKWVNVCSKRRQFGTATPRNRLYTYIPIRKDVYICIYASICICKLCQEIKKKKEKPYVYVFKEARCHFLKLGLQFWVLGTEPRSSRATSVLNHSTTSPWCHYLLSQVLAVLEFTV